MGRELPPVDVVHAAHVAPAVPSGQRVMTMKIDWNREPMKPWWTVGERILVHQNNDGRRKLVEAEVVDIKRHASKVRQDDGKEFHIRPYEGFPVESGDTTGDAE